MDSEEKKLIPLTVGNLALVGVLVTGTTCLMALLIRWMRVRLWPGRPHLHCARCHTLIAVQLPVPPSSLAPPTRPDRPATQTDQLEGGTLRRRGSVQPPAILGAGAEQVQCGKSATFQRLGMRTGEAERGVREAGRALETRALSQLPGQASPPGPATPAMELVTPSPIMPQSSNPAAVQQSQPLPPCPTISSLTESTITAQQLVSPARALPSENPGGQGKLDRVRLVKAVGTPGTRTPGNAAGPGPFLEGEEDGPGSLSPVLPARLPDKQGAGPLGVLEASRMSDTTGMTTGDLHDLCSDTAEVSPSPTAAQPQQVSNLPPRSRNIVAQLRNQQEPQPGLSPLPAARPRSKIPVLATPSPSPLRYPELKTSSHTYTKSKSSAERKSSESFQLALGAVGAKDETETRKYLK